MAINFLKLRIEKTYIYIIYYILSLNLIILFGKNTQFHKNQNPDY